MKKYYECHITMSAANKKAIKYLLTKSKWKYSAIDNDPDLGTGLKCYATRHYSYKKPLDIITKDLLETRANLSELGITILRHKIELVILDSLQE